MEGVLTYKFKILQLTEFQKQYIIVIVKNCKNKTEAIDVTYRFFYVRESQPSQWPRC